MAIKLVTGNTLGRVSERVFDEIKENGMTEGRHIVIVPDQFALLSEMEVLEYLGIKSSFNIEVAGFSRLATRVLGERSLTMLNQVTSVMLLKRVIMESESELNCYSRVCKKAGYVSEIYAVITNMRNNKITPEQLRNTASKTRGLISNKLKDIAMLYERYLKLLATDYADMGSDLESLAREIPNLEYIQNAHIYVVDFHELTRVKMDILSAFIEHSQSFTMGIVDMPNAKNSRLYPSFLVKFITAEADKLNVSLSRVDVLEDMCKERLEISDRLYSYNLQRDMKSAGHFEIKIADNKTHEVRGVARYIRSLIVDENYRYRDIVIVASDADSYKKIIAKEFADFEIPFYLDDKTNLMTTAVAKLLVFASEAVSKNMRKSEMVRLSKSAILGLTHSDINSFELYVEKYSINFSRFANSFAIGLDDVLYKGAEIVRDRLCNILAPLMCSASSTSEQMDNVREFYNIAISDSYEHYINSVNSIDKRMGKVAEIAREKVDNCICQIQGLFERLDLPLIELVEIMITAFTSIEISTIPQFVDSVFVGQADKSKYQHNKVMFLIGASDGNYPNESITGGVITANEAMIMESKGIVFSPNLREKVLLDKFYVCQLLLKASDRVILCYDTQSGEPSVLVRQVEKIAGVEPKYFESESSSSGASLHDYASKIATRRNSIAELMRYYSERMNGVNVADEKVYDYIYTKMVDDFSYQYLRADNAVTHIAPNSDAWSKKDDKTYARVSAIERYFECPFKFFCQNVLKLNEPVTGDLKPSITGDFIHKIAEKYFAENTDMSIPDSVRDEKVMDICGRVIASKEFADIARGMTAAGIEKLLFARARYSIAKLVKCHAQSDYVVSGTEVSFGRAGDSLPPLEIDVDGEKYYMRGVIDRIDKKGDSAVIIDYKTKASMSFGIKDIYYGSRVQLLLYLNAVQACEQIDPLAIYYMPLPYSYKNPNKDTTNYKYVGLTRNVEIDIAHFDREYLSDESCVPVSKNKGTMSSKGLYSKQDFDKLKKYSMDVIASAIKEIDGGYIEPKPIDKACEYCEYGAICKQKDNSEHKRYHKAVALEAKDE